MVVQHSIVGRSSQWIRVMPPASAAARITPVNCGTKDSKVGRLMKIFMLDWPAATIGATSATVSAVGEMITVWKKTSAMACSRTRAASA